jgi:tetratricopeptide (TPR) repeat protein
MGHWRAAAAMTPGLFAGLSRMGKLGIYFAACCEDRTAALADAELGDFKTADVLIAKTPRDCVPCLDIHGRIEGLEKNWHGADTLFARAVAAAPSIPSDYTDWGAMLLAKGDVDAAIAKFRIANRKGPHFADPLEMWGEALMAQNRSDLALAKFKEANEYAPNWGRLHLKWGEALFWSGDKSAAKKQFAIAAALDLTPAERGELAGMAAAPINGKIRI